MSHACVIVAVDLVGQESDLESLVAYQMEPFNEHGDWFKDGSRWDWYQIGGRFSPWFASRDSLRVRDLSPEEILDHREKSLRDDWKTAQERHPDMREFVYGVKPGESEDAFVNRVLTSWFPAAYAFLRNRHWHENERLGFFECSTATECERKAEGEVVVGKCLFREKDAQVIVWNEPKENWKAKYHRRFIAPLPPETWLVAVDYHV